MAAMPAQVYVYQARLERVIDGDTLDVTLSMGLHAYRVERLRLLSVDCPEVHGPTRVAGLAATAYTTAWLEAAGPEPWPLIVQTYKSDDFGRFLGTVWRISDGACLNLSLLDSGHAVAYRSD